MKGKGKWLYIFTLLLSGIVISYSSEAKNYIPLAGTGSYITVIAPASNSQNNTPTGGDSPFIRFHHGIEENCISVFSPGESMVPLRPAADTPEKFAGIIEYLSSLSYTLPVTREFLYSTPLRSPPIS